LAPVATLIAPDTVATSCGGVADSLLLDGTASFQFGDDDRIYEWTFQRRNATSVTYFPPVNLHQFLSGVGFSATNASVTLNPTQLITNTDYRFLLRVGRVVGGNTTAAFTLYSAVAATAVVRRAAAGVDVLKVTVLQSPVVYRATQSQLVATAAFCAQSAPPTSSSTAAPGRQLLAHTPVLSVAPPLSSPSSLTDRRLLAEEPAYTYQWSQNGGPPVTPPQPAEWWQQYRLVFSPLTLTTFATYTFSVVVTLASASATGYANVTCVASPSTPIAVVAGAQFQQLLSNADTVLNATASFDPDYPDMPTSHLRFLWDVPVPLTQPIPDECAALNDLLVNDRWFQLARNAPVVTIPAAWRCSGLRYQHVVTVRLATAPVVFLPLSAATAYVTVLGTDAPPLSGGVNHRLTVTVLHVDADSYSLASFPAAAKLRVQAVVTHETITLDAALVEITRVTDTHTTSVAENGMTLTYRWREVAAAVDARNATNLAAPADASALALRGGVMLASLSYTYAVDVDLLFTFGAVVATAFSEINVVVNAPPSLTGVATVLPPTGTAGSTLFDLRCPVAFDADEPLSFQFSIALLSTTQVNAVIDASTLPLTELTERLLSLTAQAYLPVGKVAVVCFAFDKYGAQSLPSTATVVSVAPLQSIVQVSNRTCTLDALITTTLTPAAVVAQPLSQTMQQVTAYVSSVQQADCLYTNCNIYDTLVNAVSGSVNAAIATDTLTGEATRLASQTLCVITNATFAICSAAFHIAADVVVTLLDAVSVATVGSGDAAVVCDDCLTPDAVAAVVASVGCTLSSLLAASGDCDAYARTTLLVSQLAAAAAKGALAGEDTPAVTGAGVNAVASKADGSAVVNTTASASASASFQFPTESLANVTGANGETCAEVRTVELTETALSAACRAAKASATTTASAATTATAAETTAAAAKKAADAGLDVPISSVVNADVYDCDGNVVPIADLTEPIVFTLAINADALTASTVDVACPGSTSYLPNDGEIATQSQLVSKKIECSYVDPDTGVFTSKGCEQVGDVVINDDGFAFVKCACTHLTEFAILLRESDSADESSCNLAPSSVFGSIVFLIFAVLFSCLLTLGARQTYLVYYAFQLKQKTMLVQHVLMCLVCIFRIVICIVYYLLQYESVQAVIEFKAVAIISSAPYIIMLWLCSLLATTWAAIFNAARAGEMHRMASAFSEYRVTFIAGNALASLVLVSIFVALALSTDADERATLTLVGSAFFASLATILSLSFLRYGYGLLVVLTKDFASVRGANTPVCRINVRTHTRSNANTFSYRNLTSFLLSVFVAHEQKSATRLFKVGIVFATCFLGEAVIWLYSGVAPVSFFAAFETVTSLFFALDVVALLCILGVSYRTLREEVVEKQAAERFAEKMKMRAGMMRSASSKVTGATLAKSGDQDAKTGSFFVRLRRTRVANNNADTSDSDGSSTSHSNSLSSGAVHSSSLSNSSRRHRSREG
jgi:hypothetical protein